MLSTYVIVHGDRVCLVLDPRGESESYTTYSLQCHYGERLVWTEGLRNDWRTSMRPEWVNAVETLLASMTATEGSL